MDKKVILVTGASKGIGKAIALMEGKKHSVSLFSRSESDLVSITKEIQSLGNHSIYFAGDIKKEEDIKASVEKTIAEFGKIDVLINNAGIGYFKRVDEFTYDEFDEIQKVNLYGTFLFCKYVAPHMIKAKSGYIINISSVAGLNGFKSGTAYAASKFAMNGFTESLREDLKQFGIAVSVVCPGSVLTGFGGFEEEKLKGRDYMLTSEDVARTISYLVEESETANAKLIELKPRRKKEFRD
ncbi:MAG: SDR family oxidoreductase [Leptospiraceae bacterium]|nr:SDR family oxidoreductase [Leptospiraceae bacterium]